MEPFDQHVEDDRTKIDEQNNRNNSPHFPASRHSSSPPLFESEGLDGGGQSGDNQVNHSTPLSGGIFENLPPSIPDSSSRKSLAYSLEIINYEDIQKETEERIASYNINPSASDDAGETRGELPNMSIFKFVNKFID